MKFSETVGSGEILCESMKQMKILTSEGSDKISEMVGSGENIHLYSVERQMKFLEIEGSDKNVYESRDQMKMSTNGGSDEIFTNTGIT